MINYLFMKVNVPNEKLCAEVLARGNSVPDY